MSPSAKRASSPKKVSVALNILERAFEEALNHSNQLSHRRRFLFSFLMGLLYGLGFIFAVALAIPFTVLLLQKIEWVPIIGGLLQDIAQWLSSHAGSRAT